MTRPTEPLNMTHVAAMRDHYLNKIKTNPTLYTNERDGLNAVVVTLPQELVGWANRSAGHSGFGAGARPVGIRKNCSNSHRFLSEIFSSVQSLARFIESSECDADEYMVEVRQRHAARAAATVTVTVPGNPNDRLIKSVGSPDQIFGAGTLKTITAKHKPERVRALYDNSTIAEFATLLGLPLPIAA